MELESSPQKDQDISARNVFVSKKILIVEDDKNMTVFLGKAVLELYSDTEITWAASLEQAVTKLIKNTDINQKVPFDLIIADIFLEGSGTGLDLYKVIGGLYPTIPFLIISTVSPQKISELIGNEKKVCYLQKPFMFTPCKEKIKNMLTDNFSKQVFL